MKRRPTSRGKAAKSRQPKATGPKGVAGQGTVVARLTRERDEALLREAANSEILRLISKSGVLETVFRTILENATRICNANFGVLNLHENGALRMGAMHNVPKAFAEWLQERRGAYKPIAGSPPDRVMRTKKVSYTVDNATEANPGRAAVLGGARSTVCVPMLKDDELVGTITIYRQEVRPFTKKQIELLQTFAAQAVIAIENARLLSELRESLQQQTASADVLRIISSSPGELEPVFSAILKNAVNLCEATLGNLFLYNTEDFVSAAVHALSPDYAASRRPGLVIRHPHPEVPLNRLARTKELIHIADVRTEKAYIDRDPVFCELVDHGGARTLLVVPMMKEQDLIGAVAIYRQEVHPFTDQQIELVKNFAAQAVIAIENARLLSELRESLEQQTATAEVLNVIARTRGELQPVFQTMLAKATELCGASYGALWLRVDDGFRYAALHGDLPQIWTEHLRSGTVIRVRPDVPLARLLQTLRPVSIPDMRTDPGYLSGDPLPVSGVDVGGIRTLVLVPMIKNNDLVGAIAIYGKEARPFAEKQIELLSNFAAQAVIAIENARLLSELRQRTTDLSESLEQQTATSEVLKVISSSPGELEPVFNAMLENAVRICEANFGNLWLREDDAFRTVVMHGATAEYTEARQRAPLVRPSAGTGLARALQTKQVVQIADIQEVPGYVANPMQAPIIRLAGARTMLSVPMLKEQELLGVIEIYRTEVQVFTEKQIALVQNFAAQAVIAIENTRLLSELRERTEEVLKLNQQLEVRVADQVGEIERMSRLRRFLPPQVADLIVASGTERQLESHRREITALFCDLRGFTGFSESSDPEDVMTLLRQYHAVIGEIIIKYSGTLERYAGDGVMVVFNDPVPVDNPALQAVRMALDMRAALGALIEKWRRLGHELGFGIGIAHGYATLGTIGFEGRFDYAAIGTVSNVASRLCDEAKPGQILISPRVLMAIEDAVGVEAVGDFALKGISRPLAAYNVVGMK